MKALRSVHTEAGSSQRPEGPCLSSAPLSISLSAAIGTDGRAWANGSGAATQAAWDGSRGRNPELSTPEADVPLAWPQPVSPSQPLFISLVISEVCLILPGSRRNLHDIESKDGQGHPLCWNLLHKGARIFCISCPQPCGLFPVPPGTRSVHCAGCQCVLPLSAGCWAALQL